LTKYAARSPEQISLEIAEDIGRYKESFRNAFFEAYQGYERLRQERQKQCLVHVYVCFLRSSVTQGLPMFRIDLYDEGGIVDLESSAADWDVPFSESIRQDLPVVREVYSADKAHNLLAEKLMRREAEALYGAVAAHMPAIVEESRLRVSQDVMWHYGEYLDRCGLIPLAQEAHMESADMGHGAGDDALANGTLAAPLPFLDAEIIARRMAAKKDRALSVASVAAINGTAYTFRRMRILDGTLSAIVPDSFEEMAPEEARLKYPSELRPQCILASEDGESNIAFNLFDYPATADQIGEKLGDTKEALKRMNPAYVIMSDGVETLENAKMGYFDFKSYAFDRDAYNLVFVTSAHGSHLMGTFNCPFELYKDWKRIALRMILSIQETGDE
jgi:hypothetical protein